jgi:hypothetical protein
MRDACTSSAAGALRTGTRGLASERQRERGGRDAVSSPVPMDAARTSVLLLANTRCAAVGRSRPALVSARSFALRSGQQLFCALRRISGPASCLSARISSTRQRRARPARLMLGLRRDLPIKRRKQRRPHRLARLGQHPTTTRRPQPQAAHRSPQRAEQPPRVLQLALAGLVADCRSVSNALVWSTASARLMVLLRAIGSEAGASLFGRGQSLSRTVWMIASIRSCACSRSTRS